MIAERRQPGLQGADELILTSSLADMAKLPEWIEQISARYDLSEAVKFAISLCLEEAVSNVIRHGYAGQPGSTLTVSFEQQPEHYFVVTVDDTAPRFDPLAQAELPPVGQQAPGVIGGQGVRLMRGFADSLEYEPTPGGNRLRMGFAEKTSQNRSEATIDSKS